MSKIDIRPAKEKDLDTLREFEQRLIAVEQQFDTELKSSGVIYYDLEHLIADDLSNLLVAESSGEVIGSGYGQIRESKSCFKSPRHCYLGFIFVKESSRGLGVAKAIIDSICSWSEERGVNYFLLDVYSDNNAAVRAYENLGFKTLSTKMEFRR